MSTDADDRRDARADWPVTIAKLGHETDDPVATADARLAMMWELVTQAWGIAGKQLPEYDREHAPVRVLRGGEGNGR